MINALLSKNLCEVFDQKLVQFHNLVFCPWYPFVIVMASRIASPNDEVYRIFQMLVDPVEGGIDKKERGVAIRSFCTEFSGGALASVAS